MFKKLSTIKLLGILVALVLVYLTFNFFDNNSRSKSFKDDLVVIDTTKVDRITIEKGGDQLELKKESGKWKVQIDDNQYKTATISSVKNTLASLMSIKPSRIVARSEDKWSEYEVDSTGTRVKIFEREKNTLDLVIGKLQFVDQRNYYTYVRLFDDSDTYVADNFLSMSISPSPNNYRDDSMLKIKKDSIQRIQFNYADSSFALTASGDHWEINGNVTDSASTTTFFNRLANLSSTRFFDDELPGNDPNYSVIIIETNGATTEVNGWLTSENEVIVQSASNTENPCKDKALAEKLFKNQAYFFEED